VGKSIFENRTTTQEDKKQQRDSEQEPTRCLLCFLFSGGENYEEKRN
jgi:hypothetical protein